MSTLDQRTFRDFATLIEERSGICLNDGKQALITARLGKRMRELGVDDYRSYFMQVMESSVELGYLLDSVATNVTEFFRHPEHFELVRRVVREKRAAGQTRFRFWSAACSTGDEPYSLAMTVLDEVGEGDVDLKILATDLSAKALTRATSGEYGNKQLETVPDALRKRFFTHSGAGAARVYKAATKLRERILFRQFNLTQFPYPTKSSMDFVFCRNVLIYFNESLKQKIVSELTAALKPGGILITGLSESLMGLTTALVKVEPSVYQKGGG